LADWSLLYSRLQKDKERLDQEIKNHDHMDLASSLTDSVSELSAYDNHPADLGTETFEREKDLGILDALRIKMKNVDHALERMKEGEYGLCERCGSEIPTERLNAIPETSYCIDCQKEVEELTSERERPLEEEVLGPPFGRSFLDDSDNVGTDGEDVWQEVARYGTSETPQDIGGGLLYEEMYSGNDENSLVEEVDGIISEEFPEGIPPDPSP
jgi:YteA family regulatory protein